MKDLFTMAKYQDWNVSQALHIKNAVLHVKSFPGNNYREERSSELLYCTQFLFTGFASAGLGNLVPETASELFCSFVRNLTSEMWLEFGHRKKKNLNAWKRLKADL